MKLSTLRKKEGESGALSNATSCLNEFICLAQNLESHPKLLLKLVHLRQKCSSYYSFSVQVRLKFHQTYSPIFYLPDLSNN